MRLILAAAVVLALVAAYQEVGATTSTGVGEALPFVDLQSTIEHVPDSPDAPWQHPRAPSSAKWTHRITYTLPPGFSFEIPEWYRENQVAAECLDIVYGHGSEKRHAFFQFLITDGVMRSITLATCVTPEATTTFWTSEYWINERARHPFPPSTNPFPPQLVRPFDMNKLTVTARVGILRDETSHLADYSEWR